MASDLCCINYCFFYGIKDKCYVAHSVISSNIGAVDEVESLAAARQAALSGSEPSDSIRVLSSFL